MLDYLPIKHQRYYYLSPGSRIKDLKIHILGKKSPKGLSMQHDKLQHCIQNGPVRFVVVDGAWTTMAKITHSRNKKIYFILQNNLSYSMNT